MLSDGYHDVPTGKVAAVVTELDMRAPAPLRGRAAADGVSLRHVPAPDPGWYRALFTHVGQDWLWFSRLRMPDAQLQAILADPLVEVFAVERDGRPQGLLELDFRTDGECELAYFGLGPALVGSGTGAWLMDQAITMAWARPIRRFHVHTCTLDHPSALGFYIRSGFTPTKRMVEIADDPRLSGVMPETCAPQIPILR
ncbi:hypothetical protein LA6_000480 [Marinibacterium anthonyi]|nr:hypothetical protein LA6_000480 [Marinibacterium anthonyi]